MSDLPQIRIIDPDDLAGPVRSLFHLPQPRLDALRALDGAELLIEVFADRPGTYLVGGAVRDLLLGAVQFDLDVLVEGDAVEAAEALALANPGAVTRHERFLTAVYRSDDAALTVDFAQARTETYAQPGALPEVTPADIEADLSRRDFTINAIAVALWRESLGKVFEHPGATEDLKAGLLRVTHDRSFHDDPTRLLRLLRYGARLGFAADAHTEQLARRAVADGVVAEVSGGRIRDELLDLFGEQLAVVAVEAMMALELDRALHPEFNADEYVVARALNERAAGLRQDLLLLALCSREMGQPTLDDWLAHLKLRRADSAIVRQAAQRGPQLLAEVASTQAPSELDALLRPLHAETIVFALALPGAQPDAATAARQWLKVSHSGILEIDGTDLRSAGISEGPAIGRALAAASAATLDGRIAGREQQLALALDNARSGGENQ